MPVQPSVSPEFLADPGAVCPQTGGGLSPSFLDDLEHVYAEARASAAQGLALSADDLASLAGELEAWRSQYQDRLRRYLAQLPDDDPVRSPVSLFGTMDYGRLETAHTRALAWLLDGEEHGFGSQLLEALLRRLLEGRPIGLIRVEKVDGEFPVDGGRIDILAEGHWEEKGSQVTWRLVIEAKIGAEEGEEQLSVYDRWLERNSGPAEVLRVFLTPDDHREPRTSSAAWQPLSFLTLASVLRRVSLGLRDRPGYHFLQYYLAGVLRDICDIPVPISADSRDPYAAVDYLQSVLGDGNSEDDHDRSR